MADGLTLLRREVLLRSQLRAEKTRRETADRPVAIQLGLGADVTDDEADEGDAKEAHVGDDEKGNDRGQQPGRKRDGDEDRSCGHVLPPAVTPKKHDRTRD